MKTIKAHNLNNQFEKNEINVQRMILLPDILSAKVEFLTQFNGTKYKKTGIEYVEQMTYAVGSLMLKSIVVMHSCPTAYVIKHSNRALIFFKNG